MNKHRLSNVIAMLIVCLILVNVLLQPICAYSIESFLVDVDTKWEKYQSERHRGTTTTSYKYLSLDVKNEYGSYVTSGIGLWTYHISCTEGDNSSQGTVEVDDVRTDATAITDHYSPNNDHFTTWKITICIQMFDQESDTLKSKTIAHEIGHVYGLHHVNQPNQIMYSSASESKYVTSYDTAGMDVMTHSHMHTGTYSTTLEQHSAYTHKSRCDTCHAYHFANCSYTDYHSGMRHYLVVNCSCGNQHTESWSCSGNPCMFPFLNSANHETE